MSETSFYINAGVESVAISEPSALRQRPDAAFVIGECPDGLPLVLHVRRRVDVRGAVLGAMRRPEALPPPVERALGALEAAVEKTTLGLGISGQNGHSYYESVGTVASMLDRTLMSRMLGVTSPMLLPEGGRPAVEERFENSALFSLRDLAEAAAPGSSAAVAPDQPAATTGRDARLRVDLDGAQVTAVAAGEGAPRGVSAGRPVIWESLLALVSARFCVRDGDGKVHEGKLEDRREYIRALRPASWLGWSVARSDVAWLLLELARSVDRLWHAKGRVHGDLKPANVLLRKNGIDAFDALDVASGELSLGLTASWAAPEQILARAVTPATDVFALALMTISLLGASIYGEERTMIVPARGGERKRIKMITDPEVWLDPTRLEWPARARVAWRELLMRCLAQDPARRPQRGEELAALLSPLIREWPLPGRLQVACGPGRLDFLLGSREPVWVLVDSR